MAFNVGDYITASKLNEVNGQVYKTVKTVSWGWKPSYTWYSHRESGALLCYIRIKCGMFGGAKVRVDKVDASGNRLASVYSKDFGWFTDDHANINSQGPGWYRLYTAEETQIDADYEWRMYSGQTNCQANKYLTLYDDPAVSGNRLIGSYITAELLNKGRGGTLN